MMRKGKPLSCPWCGGSDSSVSDSRKTIPRTEAIPAKYRRRKCLACEKRFTTYEITKQNLEKFLAYRKALLMLREVE